MPQKCSFLQWSHINVHIPLQLHRKEYVHKVRPQREGEVTHMQQMRTRGFAQCKCPLGIHTVSSVQLVPTSVWQPVSLSKDLISSFSGHGTIKVTHPIAQLALKNQQSRRPICALVLHWSVEVCRGMGRGQCQKWKIAEKGERWVQSKSVCVDTLHGWPQNSL